MPGAQTGPGRERDRRAEIIARHSPKRTRSRLAKRPPPRLDTRQEMRVLNLAIHSLIKRFPDASARQTLTRDQTIAASGAALFLTGLTLAAPHAVLTAAVTLAETGFAALIVLRLLSLLTPPVRDTAPPLSDGKLPLYTLLIPLYREAAALPGLIAAIRALDYPADRIDAKLVIEADDTETMNAARRMDLGSRFQIIPVPSGGPRTKPKALNYALAFARGSLVTIYDAEDWPHPGQLRAAAAALAADPTLACVQAPLGCYNSTDNGLTAAFALEYAIHFHVWLPFLIRLGLPIPLGGTSNHFVRARLRAAGAWDPYNVTEDADLGFRLSACGWRCGMIAPPTGEEATTEARAWTRQRSRWIKGYLQTLLVRMRRRRNGAGWRGAAGLGVTLLAGVVSAFLYAPAMLALTGWSLAALTGLVAPPPVWACALPFCAWAAAMACAIPAARRACSPALLRAALWQPIYWLLQTPAAIQALFQLINRPHYWEKTEHGAADRRPR